jgi:hypothetical protein
MSLAGSPWFVRAAATMAGSLYLHDQLRYSSINS